MIRFCRHRILIWLTTVVSRAHHRRPTGRAAPAAAAAARRHALPAPPLAVEPWRRPLPARLTKEVEKAKSSKAPPLQLRWRQFTGFEWYCLSLFGSDLHDEIFADFDDDERLVWFSFFLIGFLVARLP